MPSHVALTAAKPQGLFGADTGTTQKVVLLTLSFRQTSEEKVPLITEPTIPGCCIVRSWKGASEPMLQDVSREARCSP
jgi:hypothetical protein